MKGNSVVMTLGELFILIWFVLVASFAAVAWFQQEETRDNVHDDGQVSYYSPQWERGLDPFASPVVW